jgi:hypothetical protein
VDRAGEARALQASPVTGLCIVSPFERVGLAAMFSTSTGQERVAACVRDPEWRTGCAQPGGSVSRSMA